MKKRALRTILLLMILGGITMSLLYKPVIKYLTDQASKPSGFVGQVITKIWSNYFNNLSDWSIGQLSIKQNARILDIGFGGGSNIKNLMILDQQVTVYGIDVSEESYKTATNLNRTYIDEQKVFLTLADVADMEYESDYFDVLFAIQTHMYWDELDKGLAECYRVLKDDGYFLITSEIDKIEYHLAEYGDSEKFRDLLLGVGFEEVEVLKEGNYISYKCKK